MVFQVIHRIILFRNGKYNKYAHGRTIGKNQQPQGKPCGIEDFFLKALCMRGNKSPAPQ
jgi:hypothetical protein